MKCSSLTSMSFLQRYSNWGDCGGSGDCAGHPAGVHCCGECDALETDPQGADGSHNPHANECFRSQHDGGV